MLGISGVGTLPMALLQGSRQDARPLVWTTTGEGATSSYLRQSRRSSQHLCPQDDRSSLLNPTLNIHGCSGVPAHLPPASPSCSPACGYTGLPCYICSTDHAQHFHTASAPLIIIGESDEEEAVGTAAQKYNQNTNRQPPQVTQRIMQNPSQPPTTILDPRNLFLDNPTEINYFRAPGGASNLGNLPRYQYPFTPVSNASHRTTYVQDLDDHSHIGREPEHHQSTSNLVPDQVASSSQYEDKNANDSKLFLCEFLSLAIMVVAIPLFLVLVFIIYIL